MHKIFDFASQENCEKTIQKTWAEFRQQLADEKFLYSDVDCALQSTFLRVFDDLFQHCHRFLEKRADEILDMNTGVVRAARIKPGAPAPVYDRFIPKAEFITEDNRFSPPGVEWLYLAFATQTSLPGLRPEEKCALMECRATSGEKFALCDFQLEEKYKDRILIDLTIAKESKFEDINYELEQQGQEISQREISKGIISGMTRGIVLKPQINDIIPALEKWTVYTYAKLLAEQIFLPITTENKSLMYAPFQCVAQYFLSKGYCGIVYSSTVFPSGKNVVLFDKLAAYPYGAIRSIIIPDNL
jgi:hypothetical protein